MVRFSKGFKENGLRFPGSDQPDGLTVCPKSTQVGRGTAEASSLGPMALADVVPAKLTVYNGEPYKTKAPTLIFIASLNGTPAAELDFRVQKQSTGPYGFAFDNMRVSEPTPAPPHPSRSRSSA